MTKPPRQTRSCWVGSEGHGNIMEGSSSTENCTGAFLAKAISCVNWQTLMTMLAMGTNPIVAPGSLQAISATLATKTPKTNCVMPPKACPAAATNSRCRNLRVIGTRVGPETMATFTTVGSFCPTSCTATFQYSMVPSAGASVRMGTHGSLAPTLTWSTNALLLLDTVTAASPSSHELQKTNNCVNFPTADSDARQAIKGVSEALS
mmetsp:Transcript_78576/g.163262  ORF Transcript_78576/g.163262 Transcript_78576/m.163262 type:complete len:206 (-) Transcript_78576:953-1570(-)